MMGKRTTFGILGIVAALVAPAGAPGLSAAEVIELEVEGGASREVAETPAKPEAAAARIQAIRIEEEDKGASVRVVGENLPEPSLTKLSKGRFLLKFPRTRLEVSSRVSGRGAVVAVRSAMHEGGVAWVVADTMGVRDGSVRASGDGWVLALETGAPTAPPKKKRDPAPAAIDSAPKDKGGLRAPGRLLQAAFRETKDDWNVVLTSDGPLPYTLRRLSKPEKLVLRMPNTRLDLSETVRRGEPGSPMVEKGGLLLFEARQLGPKASPTSEVIFTLRPGTVHTVERDLNQLVISLRYLEAGGAVEAKGDLHKRVSFDLTNADLVTVLKTLGAEAGFDVDIRGVTGTVTEKVTDMPLKSALAILLASGGYHYDVQGNLLRIGTTAELLATKARLPQTIEILPAGGMNAAQLDSLVRAVLDPTNGVQTTVDAQRNALILKGTASDISGYKRTIRELDLSVSGDERVTRIVNLNYLTTAQMSTFLTPYLTPQGQIQADATNQTLVIREIPENMDVLLELVRELDVKPPQVLIESTIVEITAEKALSLGVDWTADRLQDPTLSGSVNLRTPTGNPGEIVFGTVRSGFDVDATLQALQETRDAKVISKPRIATANNVAASIQTIEEVVFISIVQSFQEGNPVPIVTESIQTLELPIQLNVTPRITSDGQITTQISASIRSVSGLPPQSTLGGSPPPPTTTQTATTTLTIKNGETIVIGGLVRDVAQERVRKVPLLGSLPLLGGLFRNTEKTNRKVELVIFITPTLLEA